MVDLLLESRLIRILNYMQKEGERYFRNGITGEKKNPIWGKIGEF